MRCYALRTNSGVECSLISSLDEAELLARCCVARYSLACLKIIAVEVEGNITL